MFTITDTTVDGTFYNQQGGKNHSFDVVIEKTKVRTRSEKLRASLVYADTLENAPHSIFRVLKVKDFNQGSVASFTCRINDVSRNHQGRRFRVKVQTRTGEPYYSSPILVKSKRIHSKNKKKRKFFSSISLDSTSQNMKKSCMSLDWQNRAFRTLKKLAWQIIGYERSAFSPQSVDMSLPIVQCSCCQAICKFGTVRRHKPSCSLKRLIQEGSPDSSVDTDNSSSSSSGSSSGEESTESLNTQRILAPDTPEFQPIQSMFFNKVQTTRSLSDQLLADDDELAELLDLDV